MEEELSRMPLKREVDETIDYPEQQLDALDDEEFLSQDYHHNNNASSVDDKGSIEQHQEWPSGASEKCNLIVNYLPHEIDDSSLKSLFAEHGDIAVAKVVKDKLTKKSLGFGFVKFIQEDDAIAAIEAKNGFLMGPKKLKVSLARPPSIEIRNCKLYITNLPKEFSEREVTELFSQFGEIIECRVLKDRTLKSNKGVAFVQFNLKSQADNALSLNDFRLQGCDRHLVVKYAEDQHKKKDRRGQMGNGSHSNNSNSMDEGMNQDGREPYFYPRSRMLPAMYRNLQNSPMLMGHNSPGLDSQYLPSTSVGYPPSRGISKNSGSPSMSGDSNPLNSLDWYGQMPQMVYDNQMVHNQSQMHNQALGYDQINQHMMAQQQGQPQQRAGPGLVYMRSPRASQEPVYNSSVTLIVSSLPQHADIALLHDLCAPYGQIISAQVDVNPSNSQQDVANGRGGCSGRGRVQMASLTQAQYATQALNGAIIFEGGRPLQVSIASDGARSAGNQQLVAAASGGH